MSGYLLASVGVVVLALVVATIRLPVDTMVRPDPSFIDTPFFMANHWQTWALNRLGLIAIVMPWGRVYVTPDHIFNQEMFVHEGVHLDQIARDGALAFTIKYLVFLAWYGYRKNPYEVEAYEISDKFMESYRCNE